MKILYDHQIFSHQVFGGVSRYFTEIIKRLPIDSVDISVKYSNNIYFEELNKLGYVKHPYKNFFKNHDFYKRDRIMLEMGKTFSIKKIKEDNFDILHLTHYESYANNKTNKPIVINYHDKMFSTYNYNARTVREQRKCIERADAIITESNNTKKDLIELFDCPEEKIHVIYLGATFSGEKRDPIFNEPYILFVGGRLAYKNFKKLLLAFSLIKENNIKLFCVGSVFTTEELEYINQLGISNRVVQKRVSDSELMSLYQHALCFVFPSLYEGFGLPLLEAMGNNCPVVCSNASCFPEVAKDAALFFNPHDEQEMANQICNVIQNNELRKSLIEKGNIRVKDFSWEKAAEMHIALYKSLVQ